MDDMLPKLSGAMGLQGLGLSEVVEVLPICKLIAGGALLKTLLKLSEAMGF